MYSFYIKICIVVFFPLCLTAQNNEQPSYAAKHQKIDSIFQSLKKVCSIEKNTDNLKLNFIATKDKELFKNLECAWTDGSTVYMREDFYDTCINTKNPDGALAFVLAHEIVHCIKKHTSSTILCTTNTTFVATQKNLDATQEEERIADKLGYLYARIAGYAPSNADQQVMEVLYQKYKLLDNSFTHPSLQERIAIAKQDYTAAEHAYYQYEHGLIACILHKHLLATQNFYHIENSYKIAAPEVLNNEAVSILMVLCHFKDDTIHKQAATELQLEGFFKNAQPHYSSNETRSNDNEILMQLYSFFEPNDNTNSDAKRYNYLLERANTLLQKALSIASNNTTILKNIQVLNSIKTGNIITNNAIRDTSTQPVPQKNKVKIKDKYTKWLYDTPAKNTILHHTDFKYTEISNEALKLKTSALTIIINDAYYKGSGIENINIGDSTTKLQLLYDSADATIKANDFCFLHYTQSKVLFKIDKTTNSIVSIVLYW